MTDRASQALAESRLLGKPCTYDTIAKRCNVPLSTLRHRDRGRPSREAKAQRQQYLTPSEEGALEKYVRLLADLGTPVRVKFLSSLAFIIARQRSTTNDKAINPPNKNWAQGFQKRHPDLKSRRVRAMDWQRHENNTYDKITHWFEVIAQVLQDPAILPKNVYNMDETGVMLCKLGSVKVLVGKDDLRDYRGASVKRTTITAIECISADGRSLLPMIIWPATTHRSNWTTFSTPGWHYACSETGYTNSNISFEWIKRVFDPQTKDQANGKPRVLICDGFGTHETLEILEFCFENNIILCRLPSHTSHKLQPCDVGVFAPLKATYRDEAERLLRGGVNTTGKEHFTFLYSPSRDKAFSKRNITKAWAATGLFPFNPDRVLRRTPKPPTAQIAQLPCEISRGSGVPDEVPPTPTTPACAEAFVSLYNLIKQDTLTLDETSISRVQRRVQKLANAGQKAIAYCALLEDEKQMLKKINNEAKVRRSTKSVVLGKANVMSYEDILAARAAKDLPKGKGKRGRKRKRGQPDQRKSHIGPQPDLTPETEPEPEPEPEVDLEADAEADSETEPQPEPEVERGLQSEIEPEMEAEVVFEPDPNEARPTKKSKGSTGRCVQHCTSIVGETQELEQQPVLAQKLTWPFRPATWSAPVARMF